MAKADASRGVHALMKTERRKSAQDAADKRTPTERIVAAWAKFGVTVDPEAVERHLEMLNK
jgi:hypothetical protein